MRSATDQDKTPGKPGCAVGGARRGGILPILLVLALGVPGVRGAQISTTAPAPASAPATQPLVTFTRPDTLATLSAFARYIDQSAPGTAAQKARIHTLLDAARKDPAGHTDALAQSLAILYPDFGQALITLAQEDAHAALPALRRLAGAGDPYLAAHAALYLARVLTTDKKYEDAMPYLKDLTGAAANRTLNSGEALFLRGVCEAGLLDRRQAQATLQAFLKLYPDASQRLHIGALQMLAQLQNIKDGSLWDVESRMGYAERKLGLDQTGQPTQDQQSKVIALLDMLIKQSEDKENQGGGGGGGAGGMAAGARSSSPAQRSIAPAGKASVGQLHSVRRGNPADTWGALNKRQRQEVLDALKGSLPERDRALIEQYFQSLQEEPGK